MLQQLSARSAQPSFGLKAKLKQYLARRQSTRHTPPAPRGVTFKPAAATAKQLPLEPAESFKMQDIPEFDGGLDMRSLGSKRTGLPMWTFACTDFSNEYSPAFLVRSDYDLKHPYQGTVLSSGGFS